MTNTKLNILLSVLFVGLVSWVYKVAIIKRYDFMGFEGEVTLTGAVIAILLAALLAYFLPRDLSARSLHLTILHYAFFLPSIVVVVFEKDVLVHAISLVIAYVGLHVVSAISVPSFVLRTIERDKLLWLLICFTIAALLIQIYFGGLDHFNLNLEAVYEFRRAAASDLPPVVGYIYSNVSNVLIPICLVLSILYRKWFLAVFTIAAALALFGMTHHKAVFFTPFAVLILVFAFRFIKSPAHLGYVFLAFPIFAVFEIIYIDYFLGYDFPKYYTSYSIRRVFLVPPMLDNVLVTFFSDFPKYYWSTSRLGFGLVDAPADVPPPFLVGREVFNDPDTSSNTGVIGSGFANAGYLGVAIYSAAVGFIVSFFNTHGHRLGHAFVAATTIILLFTIQTSTDLTTAILTHGLLLFVIILILSPDDVADVSDSKKDRAT